MEQPLSYTGDSYGTDGKVNLPNFTEDVDWKGLEDLYSINKSLYGYRNKYELSPDDWTNYLKDVDRIFALLKNIPKKVAATVLINTYASSDNSTLVEMSSADSEDEFSGLAADEREPTMEIHFLNLSTVMLNHKEKLETNNDLPEEKKKTQAHWNYSKLEKLKHPVSLDTYEMDLSGNGFTELESRITLDLQTLSYAPGEMQQGSLTGDDLFKDQVYLPIDSMAHDGKNLSNPDRLVDSESLEGTQARSSTDSSGRTNTNFDTEGSASFPYSLD